MSSRRRIGRCDGSGGGGDVVVVDGSFRDDEEATVDGVDIDAFAESQLSSLYNSKASDTKTGSSSARLNHPSRISVLPSFVTTSNNGISGPSNNGISDPSNNGISSPSNNGISGQCRFHSRIISPNLADNNRVVGVRPNADNHYASRNTHHHRIFGVSRKALFLLQTLFVISLLIGVGDGWLFSFSEEETTTTEKTTTATSKATLTSLKSLKSTPPSALRSMATADLSAGLQSGSCIAISKEVSSRERLRFSEQKNISIPPPVHLMTMI